ncbi:MAG: DNA-protecting protein DprA, partial [Actinomycetota bacterium]|nr:DNA-protecting protein DprA [Actinomycetota bacterium]
MTAIIERVFGMARQAPLPERAAVLALVGATRGEWHRTAALIEDAGSALRVVNRDWAAFEPFDVGVAEAMAAGVEPADIARYEALVADYERRGIHVVTVLDSAYPTNLRHVYNRPPFLFVRGDLREADNRAIAIVGTRSPSDAGLEQAARLSAGLATQG